MAQFLSAFGFKGSGIVGLFIVAGLATSILLPNTNYGDLFLTSGFGVGLILVLLGVFAVAKRVVG